MAEAGQDANVKIGKSGIVTIYRSFEECVSEIQSLEALLRPVPPRFPHGGIGPAVEQFSMSYGESLAELRRLALVNAMSIRKGVK